MLFTEAQSRDLSKYPPLVVYHLCYKFSFSFNRTILHNLVFIFTVYNIYQSGFKKKNSDNSAIPRTTSNLRWSPVNIHGRTLLQEQRFGQRTSQTVNMPPRLVNLMYSSYISFVYWPTKFIRKTSNKDGCQEQKRSEPQTCF